MYILIFDVDTILKMPSRQMLEKTATKLLNELYNDQNSELEESETEVFQELNNSKPK